MTGWLIALTLRAPHEPGGEHTHPGVREAAVPHREALEARRRRQDLRDLAQGPGWGGPSDRNIGEAKTGRLGYQMKRARQSVAQTEKSTRPKKLLSPLRLRSSHRRSKSILPHLTVDSTPRRSHRFARSLGPPASSAPRSPRSLPSRTSVSTWGASVGRSCASEYADKPQFFSTCPQRGLPTHTQNARKAHRGIP